MGLLKFLFGHKKPKVEASTSQIHYTGQTHDVVVDDLRGTSYEVIDRESGKTYWTSAEPPHFPSPRYFASFGVIASLKREQKFEEAYAVAWEALQLLPIVVKDWHDRFNMEFGVASVPPLEYIVDHLIMTTDRKRLKDVKAILDSPPELRNFYSVIDYASERITLFERIRAYLKAQPGCLQNSLREGLGY